MYTRPMILPLEPTESMFLKMKRVRSWHRLPRGVRGPDVYHRRRFIAGHGPATAQRWPNVRAAITI